MAYTSLNQLETMPSGNLLDLCTAAEDGAPASFYPEDIAILTGQSGYHSAAKRMAKFWGERHPVWVGFTSGGAVLQGVIALICPPYYPPHSFPTQYVTAAQKPSRFP